MKLRVELRWSRLWHKTILLKLESMLLLFISNEIKLADWSIICFLCWEALAISNLKYLRAGGVKMLQNKSWQVMIQHHTLYSTELHRVQWADVSFGQEMQPHEVNLRVIEAWGENIKSISPVQTSDSKHNDLKRSTMFTQQEPSCDALK